MDSTPFQQHLSFWQDEVTRLRGAATSPERNEELAQCLYNLALCHGQGQQWPQARQCLRKALDLSPNWAEAWNNLGCVLYSLAEPLSAHAAWSEAARLDPTGEAGRTAQENLSACPLPPTHEGGRELP